MGFRLEKWYADLVTPTGRPLIVYRADLSLPGLPTLRYAATLTLDEAGHPHTTTTLRPTSTFEIQDGAIVYNEPRLALTGSWTPSELPHRARPLYAGDAGTIDWSCLQPAAHVRCTVAGVTVEGTGYVEHMRMTLPPWRMPIDELHWGRTHTSRGAIVWIEWRGDAPLRHVLWAGSLDSHASVEAGGLTLAGGAMTIEFDRSVTLRDHTLAHSLAARVPLLGRLIGAPARWLTATHETKWLSRTAVRFADGTSEAGWAIHEVVRWPN